MIKTCPPNNGRMKRLTAHQYFKAIKHVVDVKHVNIYPSK
jgi:hypothetical protein